MTDRTLAVLCAKILIGTPYRWGGNVPSDGGLDCSGLVQWVWHLAGSEVFSNFPESFDKTAQELWNELEITTDPQPGDAAFYSTGIAGRISHVVLVVDGGRIVGANGGDRQRPTESDTQHLARMREDGGMVELRSSAHFRATLRGYRRMPT